MDRVISARPVEAQAGAHELVMLRGGNGEFSGEQEQSERRDFGQHRQEPDDLAESSGIDDTDIPF